MFDRNTWNHFTKRKQMSSNLFKNKVTYVQVGRECTNGPEDRGSIPGRVIPKTQKMVLDIALLSTQQYKVRIKGKVEKSRERGSPLPYTSV